jgi:hypothetical protein
MEPKIHYCIHKSSLPIPILSHINPVHNTTTYLPKIHFNIILPSTCKSSYSLFPSGLFTKLYTHSSSPSACYALRSSRTTWPEHSNYIWWRVHVIKLLVTQFFPTSYHFIPFRYKYSPWHPVLEHPHQVSHPSVGRWRRKSKGLLVTI